MVTKGNKKQLTFSLTSINKYRRLVPPRCNHQKTKESLCGSFCLLGLAPSTQFANVGLMKRKNDLANGKGMGFL